MWLESRVENGLVKFSVDSDAVIVQGLLALVMAAYNNKTPRQILDFDVDAYFAELDLERHITPTRGNGLRAIVAKIQALAKRSVN